jgi:exopolysaccharide biosynthesis polyprenyl glycosylphosphotransferase
MSREFGRPISPELLGLWCAEVLGGSLLAYLLLSGGVAEGAAGTLLRLHAAQQAIVLALTFGLIWFAVGLYSPDLYGETGRLLAGTTLGCCLALPTIWVAGHAAGVDFGAVTGKGVLLPLGALAGWVLFVLAVRLAFSHAIRADLFVHRMLVVGAGPDDDAATRLLAASQRGNIRVISVLPAREAVRLTPALLKGRKVWGIIVTDAARKLLTPRQIAGWRAHNWRRGRLYGEAEFWESRLCRIDIDRPDLADVAQSPAAEAGALDAALTRGGDILLSLALLLFTLPLMLVTALLIRLEGPGPVLYRQQRVGLHGRPFMLLKFRSMRVNAEAHGPVWASSRDLRVTRVGAIIRRTRIDELPQLVNVLRGEMSFIGPRPERPHFVDQLAVEMPLYHERARVKPGLTGWAQVNYPYGASVEDARAKLSYDLYYVKHRGLALAVLILVSTVWVVLFQKGAR